MNYRETHRDALVIDAHNDTIVAHVLAGNRSIVGTTESNTTAHTGSIARLRGGAGTRTPSAGLQIDLRRMQAAGIDAGFFAIDVTLAYKNHLSFAMDGFGYLFNDLSENGSDAVIARAAEDILAAKSCLRPAIVLAIEHADCVEGSLNILQALYGLGVRCIGLTHNVSSAAADGCMEAREGVGLTQFGVKLVREMNRLGMLVDLAHVSPGGFFNALEVVNRPVIFSHGNARALCDHPRNLNDEQLRALSANRGVIGMSFVPSFVDECRPTLARLLDHVEHVAEVAGVQTVGIGSDFDGGGTLLSDVGQMPSITEGLLERGFTPREVRLILGENTLRVLREAIG